MPRFHPLAISLVVVACHPTRDRLYRPIVSNEADSTVSVIDGATRAITVQIPVGNRSRGLVADGARAGSPRVLRVCAVPGDLPFSSERAPGSDHEIAAVLARELGMELEYTEWAQHRCDAVIGMPVGRGKTRTTAPYYRSSFVFVSRADRGLDIHSLADPRLATLSIGVQLVGDNGASPPPAAALAARGIVGNVVGFPGNHAAESPAADVMRAVVDGQVDVAIVWGPFAGGFASCVAAKLVVTPVDEVEDGGVPLAFDIAIAVRRSDPELAAKLDRALVARHAEIVKILDAWQVPRVARPGGT